MHPLLRLCLSSALAGAALVALPGALARQLPPVDALGEAPVPVRMQAAAAQVLPTQVQSISREERLGLPTFIQLRPVAARAQVPGTLKSQASLDPVSAARSQFKALAPLYGITAGEVDAAPLHHVQAMAGGARLVRLTNQRDGIDVFREQATVLLDAQSQALAIGGYLGGTALAPLAQGASQARLGAADAVALVLQDYDFGPGIAQRLQMAKPPGQADQGSYQWWALPAGVAGKDGATLQEAARVKPVWFRLPQGLVSAFYVEVLVHEAGQEHAYAYVVSADDGRLLLRHNQQAHAHNFNYRVWADSVTGVPLPGAQGRNGTPHPTGQPDGFVPPLVAPSLVSMGGGINPWLPDGATLTQGNNVHAFANLSAPDGLNAGDEGECGGTPGRDFRACITGPGTFDHGYDFALGPLASTSQASSSVVNLFYVTNWLHDWFYGAGFDEAAGNAQADNFGRGGIGGDALLAQALDFDGINNANMYTRADGAPSRMRMYRFLNPSAQAKVLAPPSIARSYLASGADFGATTFNGSANVVMAQPADACTTLSHSVAGQIALVDRGGCSFMEKAYQVQQAGAVAMVMVNNQPGRPYILGSSTPALPVTIPVLNISQADGAVWKSRLAVEPVMLDIQVFFADRSSALDNAIIAHEWGHFISNRLIGDASGLNSNHAGGLGEGWGDFHALLMVAGEMDKLVPGNDRYQGAYNAGSYAMGTMQAPGSDPDNTALYGMRRYPYSTDLARNPLTFKHIQQNTRLPTNPGPVFEGDNAEVHDAGEVWASMLWECYVALLNAHPFQEAQERMKRYLVAGYKLTPINPVLTEARDALLAAAAAQDLSDFQLFAKAFAKRGAGTWAQSMPDRYSQTNDGVVESFVFEGRLELDALQLSMGAMGSHSCDADMFLDNGETGMLQTTVYNRGGLAVTGGQLRLTSTIAGLSFPDGAIVDLAPIGVGQSANVAVRVRLAGLTAPGNGRITAEVGYPGQEGAAYPQPLDLRLNLDVLPARLASDDAEAPPTVMQFHSTLAAHANAWAVKSHLPDNRVYAGSTPLAAGTHAMVTPELRVANSGNFTVSFKHRHLFESDGGGNYDGGQLMISTDGGSSWARVDGAGYNGQLFVGYDNPAGGQPAYVGASAGLPGMDSVTVDMGTTYAGQAVRLAWAIHTDQAVGDEGWEVDDILFTGLANTPFPQAVADAQLCSADVQLAGTGGTPQSAPVNTAFAQPLRVRLLGAGGMPLAGQPVVFSAPATGPSALFPGGALTGQAWTDANGEAAIAVTANATAGSYAISAQAAGRSIELALRNTGAPAGTGGPGGGGGPLTFSAASPGGQGMVTVTVQGAIQALPANAYFSQATVAAETAAGVPSLAGRSFPFGLARFALENVGVGNAVSLRIQYPGPVPAGAEYWKYGRTTPAGAAHWHRIAMAQVSADTIEITLVDGGAGDTDALLDGTITDPGGLAVLAAPGAAAAIPALSPLTLVLLAMGLAGLAWRGRRRA